MRRKLDEVDRKIADRAQDLERQGVRKVRRITRWMTALSQSATLVMLGSG